MLGLNLDDKGTASTIAVILLSGLFPARRVQSVGGDVLPVGHEETPMCLQRRRTTSWCWRRTPFQPVPRRRLSARHERDPHRTSVTLHGGGRAHQPALAVLA